MPSLSFGLGPICDSGNRGRLGLLSIPPALSPPCRHVRYRSTASNFFPTLFNLIPWVRGHSCFNRRAQKPRLGAAALDTLVSAISPSFRLASLSGRCAHGRRSEAELTRKLTLASLHKPHPQIPQPSSRSKLAATGRDPRQLAALLLAAGVEVEGQANGDLIMFHQHLSHNSHVCTRTRSRATCTLCTVSQVQLLQIARMPARHVRKRPPAVRDRDMPSAMSSTRLSAPLHRTNCLIVDQQE